MRRVTLSAEDMSKMDEMATVSLLERISMHKLRYILHLTTQGLKKVSWHIFHSSAKIN